MKKRNKILALIPVLGISLFGFISNAETNTEFKDSSFYQKINQLNIPVGNILLGNTLTRYDFTRLLNAIECQDCIMPDESMVSKYNESIWKQFQQKPGKYFDDIEYLGGDYNGTNYYYCVANIGNDDIMNGYPRGTSKCGGKFCGQWNVSKAEFFQTLSNFLMDRNMFNYSAPWGDIKKWFNKLKTSDSGYKYLNSAQIELIKSKPNQTQPITSRLEYTTYLAFCTFNPNTCGFQTFKELSSGNWPLAESNVLIRAGIITSSDVHSLNTAITPQDAVEKMWITYERHIRCEFNEDYDCDGIANHEDNCPYDYNPSQNDFDGDDEGDVCDEDIDGDGQLNPTGLVDDNGNINYGILKKYNSSDKKPFGEVSEDTAYFIQATSISQSSPTNVQFKIAGPEEPASVEWDFGDLGNGKGKTISHVYNGQGVYTVSAKITTKQNKKYVLSSQIFLGRTSNNTFNLNIEKANIDKNTAKFEASYQGEFDYFIRENKASGEKKKLKGGTAFTTTLITGERNNITVKGYANNELAASATTDVYENNGKFYTFSTVFAPQIKTIDNAITASINLVNISYNSISYINRDFGDGANFNSNKLSNNHVYLNEGKKPIIIKIELTNGKVLYATSTLNIQDPTIVGNQTYNVIPIISNGTAKLVFNNKGLTLKEGDTLTTTLNNQQGITTNELTGDKTFLELANKQGIVRINVKLKHGGMTLESNGIISFGIKDETEVNISNIDKLFEGLKCDFDKDGIPDIYDNDIDGDGVPNLLGLIKSEREDCKLIVGENVDEKIYESHFGVCSLDNCPFRSNPTQTDTNVNGIGDMCDGNGDCGNGFIDLGEDCKNCPEDVGQCTAFCGNGIKEDAETCKNCAKDMTCPSTCGNGIIDSGEQCDHGEKNGKDGKCRIDCRNFTSPYCGNGVYNEGETCITCPVDLGDICIDDGLVDCGNGKIEKGENCKNCTKDVGECTSFCGNGIAEDAEKCDTCPKDVGKCTGSCGNGEIEPGEECDNGIKNGYDGKCNEYCRIVDPTHKCGDGKKDEYEECDKGSDNGKALSQCTVMCTKYDPLKPNCGNGKIEAGETCITCPVDLGEKCSVTCGNGIPEIGEECDNGISNGYDGKCSFECKNTTSVCGNHKVETGEICDDGEDNGTTNSLNNCSKECRKLTGKAECGNGIVEGNEECDLGKNQNGKNNSICSSKCKEIKSCPNHKYNEGEDCLICPKDLGEICIGDGEKPICGNGIIEKGENCRECEADVGKCTSFCGNGIAEAAEDCKSCEKDVGKCTGSCGNNEIEPGEECDHGMYNGLDGKCTEYCRNIDPEHICGNGKIDENEQCDSGSKNGDPDSGCTKMCTFYNPLNPNCGNGIIDPEETCISCPVDLGEKCSVICGNGIQEIGEECDNGTDNGYDGKCSFECKKTKAICGNNKREGDEKCDDGKDNGTPNSKNKCSDRCTIIVSPTPVCGNGIVEGNEECDFGKTINGLKNGVCSSTCKRNKLCPNHKIDDKEDCEICPEDLGDICIDEGEKPVCGDGIIQKEENCTNCDADVGECSGHCGNGEIEASENCSNCDKDVKSCRGSCGNNEVEPGEECDNGVHNGLDGKCTEYCKNIDPNNKCGDGTKNTNEVCDKGEDNGKPESGCTKMCTEYNPYNPNCGNGVQDPGEDCDTCPVDLGEKCSAKCGNEILEIGEECDNGINNGYDGKCSFECKKTTSVCGNHEVEKGEDCDDGGDNGTKNSKNNCSIKCTKIVSPIPACGNGIKEGDEECDLGKDYNGQKDSICSAGCKEIKSCPNHEYDKGEDCDNCPEDLGEKCNDDGSKEPKCGDGKTNGDETCETCKEDVGECNAFCGNNKIEAAEDCKNCDTDVNKCTGSCGNGIVEPGEECDSGTNFNGHNGICSKDCKIINPKQICGNGIPEGTEICDEGSKNGTFESNCTLLCTKKIDSKPNCGNGKIDQGEDCSTCPIDLGLKCLHRCGDGELNNKREECDNGKGNGYDGKCSFSCKKTTGKCGNKIVEKDEECDEGKENGVNGSCSETCVKNTKPECGNAREEPGEECDLGSENGKTNSTCSKECKKTKSCPDEIIDEKEKCQTCPEDLGEICISKTVCGNGIVEGNEECDDGYRNNGKNKLCDANCKNEDKCGNGIIDEGETCKTCKKDVGNCTAFCGNGKIEEAETCLNCPEDVGECTASCGNGILEEGEQCDHGYQNGKDKKCNKNCKLIIDKTKPYCGDKNIDTDLGEKCDNGSENGKSNCSYICTEVFRPTSCGNGIIDLGETCLNCPLDLSTKCLTKCGNEKIDSPREECDNGENNGRDGKCTTQCKIQKETLCGNGTQEEGEECDHGFKDNGNDNKCTKKCTTYKTDHPNCGNGKVESDEDCNNCPIDVGICRGSCGNGKVELAEECDHGDKNGKDKLCDKDCRNIDPEKRCGNGYTDENDGEECDDGKLNGENGQCSKNCKKVTRPYCGNGKIDGDENCNNCPEDLGIKCLGHCGNNKIEEGEQCDNGDNNGKDGICSKICSDIESCGNGEIDFGEDCISCSKDLKDLCVDLGDQCGNGKNENNENCLQCSQDIGKCSGSCGNHIKEGAEECDHGADNGKDGECSENCENVDPNHYCGNNEIEEDLQETCDEGTNNGVFEKGCKINCQKFDPQKPLCGNGIQDPGEKCDDCPDDFGNSCEGRCGDGIVTSPYEECDPKADNGEGVECTDECKIKEQDCVNGNCDTICNKSIDKDCDGIPDKIDPCPELAGDPDGEYKGCPTFPDPDEKCEDGDCALVKPICNQCPCQYADYSNSLQRDDQVRARLWDKSYMVHYNYSNFVNLSNLFN